MNRLKTAGGLLVISLALAACGGGSGSNNRQVPVEPTPPAPAPEPAATGFTTFVKEQFAATSDTADPVEVEDQEFSFSDGEDPEAYRELLQ